ncbi:MAG: hypothetical protein IKQ17_08590 [Kiritimatiellae bacterium]|nr:hypothetical protein [Kiritimatiellia bacterium]
METAIRNPRKYDIIRGKLAVEFGPDAAPEDVNARILPALFPCGVVSVSSGMTLEQAYLARS